MKLKMIALVSSLAFILSACNSTTDEVDESGNSTDEYSITLNYSDHDPPTGMRTKFLQDYWFPAIEEETDGKVKINPVFGGGLLTSAEALDGVREGVADLGLIYPDNYSERMFSYELFKLFPVAPDDFEGMYEIFDTAMTELPQFSQDLEDNNQHPLLITTGLPIVFGSTNELESLDDVQGEDWRASSRWYLEAVRNMGSNPVSVPWEDVYMSLETGVIDGVMTNYDGFHMMGFYETSDNIIVGTELWWSAPFIHTINKDMWDSLPADIQEDILRASERAQKAFGEVYKEELESTIQEQRDAGATVKIADEADIETFNDPELFEDLREIWADEAENIHDIENPDEYVEGMKDIMNDALGYEEYD
ncbi:TRAP transporter substrate-binding protein DctP [Salinicoccus kekensis]|uniref:TRAP-type C4-dicarboxylate transport system substrate-binding protein n=1 Tax=Salinicoccus kekensis TaxID=714307 RepID=A0A285UQU2_9STAP|nr:TRAP transporter substrate-binding protein DctP [Salinicoccus kekensis]SOC43748.1 TRAP-type C4-dicarboxylate transport system substrate-binding protein [Salinicoccus kekensis]